MLNKKSFSVIGIVRSPEELDNIFTIMVNNLNEEIRKIGLPLEEFVWSGYTLPETGDDFTKLVMQIDVSERIMKIKAFW